MSISYQITLHSPMGPRSGHLELPAVPECHLAVVTLLGFRSQVTAEQPVPGHYCLKGQLDSVMGAFDFEADLSPQDGQFDCIAHTGKGNMRLTGVQAGKEQIHG